MNAQPSRFEHAVPVPGLIDMADPLSRRWRCQPASRGLLVPSHLWAGGACARGGGPYDPPGDVRLSRHSERQAPGRPFSLLHAGRIRRPRGPADRPKRVLIRVGAFQDALPRTVPNGADYEKRKFIPGIFDSVELTLTGAPHIVRMQAVPDVEKKSVTIHAWVNHLPPGDGTSLRMIVREVSTGRVAGGSHLRDPRRQRRGADGTGGHFAAELPALVAGDPLPVRGGSPGNLRRDAGSIRHEDVSSGPGDRQGDSQRQTVFHARQQRDAVPVLRGFPAG